MIKVPWCRFQQCSGPFTMFLIDWSSETGLFRHLSNHVFGVRNFRNAKSMRVMFLFQNIQDLIQTSNMRKKIEKKVFVCEIIVSQLVSLAPNMLANSPKIWHVNKRNFFQLTCLDSDQYI